MVMGTGIRDSRGMTSGFKYEHLFHDQNSINSFKSGGPPMLENRSFMDLPDDPRSSAVAAPTSSILTTYANTSSSLTASAELDPAEDAELFSDIVLSYISQMLMEEDVDEKFEHPALLAAEKPFYDILADNTSSSPDQPTLSSNHSSGSPDDCANNQYGSSSGYVSNNLVVDNGWPYDPLEYQQLQTHPVPVDYFSQSSFSSSNILEGFDHETSVNTVAVPDLLPQSQPAAWEQFRRGVEEARKFLPSDDKLVIDLEANGFSFPLEPKQENKFVEVKAEKEEREHVSQGSRGRKNPHRDDLELEEGRSNKQSAVFPDQTIRTEMFDQILLYTGEACQKGPSELRAAMEKEASKRSQSSQSKGSGGGKGRGKRQQPKREVVDLRTILIHCAQAVSIDDRRNANELLKQIRQHSSLYGDATQRLAHYFADGLQARLAGTGSDIYNSLVAKRSCTADILKGYHLYMSACPFKKISHFFSSQTILNVAEEATRVHIVDFGISYGFQWPCFLQRLCCRPGGPPRLRITGIDVPQPGFRPAERIEETGRRLADYCRTFKIPFEYQAIAAKWETIRVEDVHIDKDEVLIVSCLFRFKNLMDETVVVDSPRNMVLNTIRKMNPHVFIHGIVNGSYSAPFFVTRFREALFHYSAMFDMLEANVPREDAERQLIERDLIGGEALNVISCEGLERVERPETYKQWLVRILRAGFTQLPLNQDIMKKSREKVRASYHKDFVVDEDSKWLLQGWKGRIIYALSTWKPNTSA